MTEYEFQRYLRRLRPRKPDADGKPFCYGSAARIERDDRKLRVWLGAPLDVSLADWLDGYLVERDGAATSTDKLWTAAKDYTGEDKPFGLSRRALTSRASRYMRAQVERARLRAEEGMRWRMLLGDRADGFVTAARMTCIVAGCPLMRSRMA